MRQHRKPFWQPSGKSCFGNLMDESTIPKLTEWFEFSAATISDFKIHHSSRKNVSHCFTNHVKINRKKILQLNSQAPDVPELAHQGIF